MAVAAFVGMLAGAFVLWLDLGNRLFGSYVRTPAGASARIVLIVGLILFILSPSLWLTIDPASGAATIMSYLCGSLGFLLFLHFLFPYRWGITRSAQSADSSRTSLAAGIDMVEPTIRIADLPAAADGLTCLVLSDLHCNTQRDLDLLRDALAKLREQPVDVVLILGDFGENASLLPEVVAAVAILEARHGSFCVLGNHDYEGGRKPILSDLLRRCGIRLLTDENHEIAGCQTTLLGLTYPWTNPGFPPDVHSGFVICLTHSPDSILHFPALNVAVGFAGHTHGGKVSLPMLGAVLVPSLLGRFLDKGWFAYRQALLYLTPGIGYFPGRFGRNGEIVRLTLRR